ncbi:MAG: hypothetical protein KJO07_00510 [Deltaproteobacteria bacterium]|nr:hypothetical protein [Deltaproteobacteria bacterium]
MRAGLVIGAVSAALAVTTTSRADDSRYSLKLEAGSEYDSNVFRLDRQFGQASAIEGSPLARLGARFGLGWRRNRKQLLTLNGFLGTKLFTTEEAQSENVLVGSGDGSYSWSIPERSLVLSLRGSHYNAENYELLGDGRPVPSRTFATSSVESVSWS